MLKELVALLRERSVPGDVTVGYGLRNVGQLLTFETWFVEEYARENWGFRGIRQRLGFCPTGRLTSCSFPSLNLSASLWALYLNEHD